MTGDLSPKRAWYFTTLLVVLCLSACSSAYPRRNPADPDNNLVEFQFIDAETMQPLQGAYVNVVWVTPTPAGKVNGSRCVKAALLRSNAEGWVRMDGPKDSIQEIPWIMMPGYEFFTYIYQSPDANHVKHMVEAEPANIARYPAWAKNLEALGYHYEDLKDNSLAGYYKSFPIKGFVDNVSETRYPQLYFIKYRSLPSSSNFSITNVANSCGPEGENIGLDDAARFETGTRRALLHLQLLCDEKWDTAQANMPSNEISRVLWLVASPQDAAPAWAEFSKVLPNYPLQNSPGHGRSFTRDERIKFCAWMQPFREKFQ